MSALELGGVIRRGLVDGYDGPGSQIYTLHRRKSAWSPKPTMETDCRLV